MQYFYTGEVAAVDREIDLPVTTEEARKNAGQALDSLVGIYNLADMLLDIDAKNALVDGVISLIVLGRSSQRPDRIKVFLNATTAASPKRRLLVDSVAFSIEREFFRTWAHEYCHEFLVQLSIALMADELGEKRDLGSDRLAASIMNMMRHIRDVNEGSGLWS